MQVKLYLIKYHVGSDLLVLKEIVLFDSSIQVNFVKENNNSDNLFLLYNIINK